MPVQDDSAAWLQWAVSSVLGVFAVVYGTALLRLYGTVERVKDKQDQIAETARHLAEHGDREIWEAIDRLRTSMEEDRRQAAVDRREIAERMVTRTELGEHERRELAAMKEQIDRVVDLFRSGVGRA